MRAGAGAFPCPAPPDLTCCFRLDLAHSRQQTGLIGFAVADHHHIDGDSDSECVSSHNTKHIHINQDDQQPINNVLNVNNSYKNLPVQKLRSIVLEKGLSNDPSKLKKNDILKMLSLE
jgi:hypothetical protein